MTPGVRVGFVVTPDGVAHEARTDNDAGRILAVWRITARLREFLSRVGT